MVVFCLYAKGKVELELFLVNRFGQKKDGASVN